MVKPGEPHNNQCHFFCFYYSSSPSYYYYFFSSSFFFSFVFIVSMVIIIISGVDKLILAVFYLVLKAFSIFTLLPSAAFIPAEVIAVSSFSQKFLIGSFPCLWCTSRLSVGSLSVCSTYTLLPSVAKQHAADYHLIAPSTYT